MDKTPLRYVFDDVVVDPRAHRVEYCGKERPLEPKAFAVLTALLSRAGELVTRDELLDAVWGHRHITPGVLNRAIAAVRKAIGDDSNEPRYLETVHGLGYRFIAVPRTSDTTPRHEASRDDGSSQAAIGTVQSRGTYERRKWPIALAVVTVLLLGALSGRYLFKEDAASPVSSLLPSIAVLPFTAPNGDSHLLVAMEGLSESLTDTLARTPGLRVEGRESVRAVVQHHPTPRAVAQTLGVDYVVSGEGRSDASGIHMVTQLWRRDRAGPAFSEHSSVGRSELFGTLPSLATRVRDSVGIHDTSSPSTIKVSAQDLYWLGRRYWYQRTPETLARSLEYFEKALEQDPRFALAHTGVADASMLLYEYGDWSLDASVLRASSAIARAKELAPGLADAYASEGLMLVDLNDAEGAVIALERALQLEPKLPSARLWYGDALAYAGRVTEAAAVHQDAAKDDPLNPILQTYLGVDALLAGDQKGAGRYLLRATELDADYVEPYWQLALQHQLYGRLAESSRAMGMARTKSGNSDWTELYAAYADLLIDDVQAADQSIARTTGVSPIDRFEALAWLRWRQGRLAELRVEVVRDQAQTSNATNARRYDALLARIELYAGAQAAALATYDRIFGGLVDRGDPFFRPWLPDFGLGHFAAWAALLPAQSPERRRAIDAYARQLDRYAEGGVDVPVLAYQKALVAALRGDEDEASRRLSAAIERGWLDATALARDPAWAPHTSAPWFQAAQRRLSERAQAEQRVIREAHTPK